MRDSIGNVIWFAFVLALFFIFKGEPSLWDLWHAKAVKAAQADCAAPAQQQGECSDG